MIEGSGGELPCRGGIKGKVKGFDRQRGVKLVSGLAQQAIVIKVLACWRSRGASL